MNLKVKPRILISRDLNNDSILRQWADEKDVTLIEQTFISFQSVDNLEIPKTDWIFFSSPTGLKLYIEHYEIKAKKIGVYSEGTHRRLEEYGLFADYIGDSQKSSTFIGKDFFCSISSNEKVLFPSSQISMRGIVSQGNSKQVIELTSYHTNLQEFELDLSPDIIIFTSPSNVDGFLLKNHLTEDMKVIAFGSTTASHLEHYIEKERINVPVSPREEDLIALLKDLV